MTTPHTFHHHLARPAVLQISRAAGFTTTKPTVLDHFADIIGKYLTILAAAAGKQAFNNSRGTDIVVEDVGLSMLECGVLGPGILLWGDSNAEQIKAAVEAFNAWIVRKQNKEIRRIAIDDGEEGLNDYLAVLKRKYDKTEDGSRYHGTLLGEAVEKGEVAVEGGEVENLQAWQGKRHAKLRRLTYQVPEYRRQSSDLSDLSSVEEDAMTDPVSD